MNTQEGQVSTVDHTGHQPELGSGSAGMVPSLLRASFKCLGLMTARGFATKALVVLLILGLLTYMMTFVATDPPWTKGIDDDFELKEMVWQTKAELILLNSRLNGSLQKVNEKLENVSVSLSAATRVGNRGPVIKIKDIPPAKNRRRVLCWIMTDPSRLGITAIPRDTWCKKCDLALYMSSATNDTFPTIGLKVEAGRKHIGLKARAAWEYIYKYHLNDFDFFLKADPDTFIIMENLYNYLSTRDAMKLEYYGHAYTPPGWEFTYMAGGPGVVLARASVKALVEGALHNPKHSNCLTDGQGEDWKVCKCLSLVGARPVDTRDSLGRERFFVLGIQSIIAGSFPDWYKKRDTHGSVKGNECCSDYPIGFHYVAGVKMRELNYLIYKVRVKQLQ